MNRLEALDQRNTQSTLTRTVRAYKRVGDTFELNDSENNHTYRVSDEIVAGGFLVNGIKNGDSKWTVKIDPMRPGENSKRGADALENSLKSVGFKPTE